MRADRWHVVEFESERELGALPTQLCCNCATTARAPRTAHAARRDAVDATSGSTSRPRRDHGPQQKLSMRGMLVVLDDCDAAMTPVRPAPVSVVVPVRVVS